MLTTNRRLVHHVVAFLVVATWGGTFISTKLLLLGGLSAAQIFFLRFIIAYVLLLTYCLYKGIRWMADSWQDEALMAMLGLTGGSLYFLSENSAMNYTTTTNTSLIVSLSPVIMSISSNAATKTTKKTKLQNLFAVFLDYRWLFRKKYVLLQG